jgi:hypothetical protein
VSAGYINMGLRGAQALQAVEPGFWAAFSRNLPWPQPQLLEADFMELAPDGRSFFILDLATQHKTVVVQAPCPVVAPAACACAPELQASAAAPYASADFRVQATPGDLAALPWFLRDAALLRNGARPSCPREHWLKDLALASRSSAGAQASEDFWAQSVAQASTAGRSAGP